MLHFIISVNFARITPMGLLLFFPSYPVMDKCLENWQVQSICTCNNRVPTAPGKPGKMTTVFPVLEKYWNFIILLKILEKMGVNLEK